MKRARGRPKRTQAQRDDADQTVFEQEGESGQAWDGCMYFDDESGVPKVCSEMGVHIATIEVPLATVDVMWRRDLNAALTYHNTQVAPAEHPLSRGCFITMPLVLCAEHRRAMLL
jgi:hypothetical protein